MELRNFRRGRHLYSTGRPSRWASAHIRGATTFSKLAVQFLGLGYCTEQNTDGIPSFVDCCVLRNGNHTLHQKSWGGPSKFWGSEPPTPSGCALGPHSSSLRTVSESARAVQCSSGGTWRVHVKVRGRTRASGRAVGGGSLGRTS